MSEGRPLSPKQGAKNESKDELEEIFGVKTVEIAEYESSYGRKVFVTLSIY